MLEFLQPCARALVARPNNSTPTTMKTFFVTGFLAGFLALSSAQAVPIIRAIPSVSSASVGDNFTVTIGVSGLTDFAAPSLGVYDIDLVFDPALVSLGTITFGTGLDVFGFGTIQSATPGTGTVNLFELSLDSASDLNNQQLDTFVLATLNFSAGVAGTTAFDFLFNAIGDADGNPIDVDAVGGRLEIADGAPPPLSVPEPGSVPLVLAGLGAIAMRRRRLIAA